MNDWLLPGAASAKAPGAREVSVDREPLGTGPMQARRLLVRRDRLPILANVWLLLALCACASNRAAASNPTPDVRVDGFAAGRRPFGIDLVGTAATGFADPFSLPASMSVVVANSADSSVSIFAVKTSTWLPWSGYLELQTTVRGIPAPYAVAGCNVGLTAGDRALVTSPDDNSVSVISIPDGKILGKVTTGPQPHGVACFPSTGTVSAPSYRGVVSNVGDDSLVIFDVASLAIQARAPGVAGAKGAHGVWVEGGTRPRAWVAGSSANALTLVDLTSYQVLPALSVHGPTSVHDRFVASSQDSAILSYDEYLTPSIAFKAPTPADFACFGYYWFVSTGAGNSVVYQATDGVPKTVPGIAGAAGMVRFSRSTIEGALGYFVVVTSPDSDRVFLIQFAPPPPALPRDFAVVNGASFAPVAPVAPSTLASSFLATGVLQNLLANSLPLPKALGGVNLRVGGTLGYDSANSRWSYSATGSTDAGLLYLGPNQINFQIPPGISPSDSVPVQLQLPTGKTLLTTVRVLTAAPGVFSILMNGQGQGAVLNQDNSANGDPQRFLGVKPAARGSVIQIFATGAGETTPALAAGEAAPAGGNPLVLTKVQPTVTIGGKNAKVLFSGMAPGLVGLWQINAEVPQDVTPGGAVPLVVTSPAGPSSNTVTIAVQ